MRLGNVVLFERQAEPAEVVTAAEMKPGAEERGYTGRPVWGGEALFDDMTDVNAKWRPPERWGTVAKMRSDPDCGAAIDAIVLPLLSRDLTVEPGADTPEAADIAAFIANDLNNMTTAWIDVRQAALDGMLWDGTAPFEVVWAYDTGTKRYHLRKLAYRPPSSISRWHEDEHGGPDGFTQNVASGGEVRFTMDELLVFARNQTRAGLVGEPVSRRMYGPWVIKSKLQLIGGMAAEKHGVGIPVALYKGNNSAVFGRLRQMLMSLHAGAKQYALLTDLDSLDQLKILTPSGEVYDVLPQMEFHRRAIYLTTFTQFLPLGSDGVGARALGDSHLDAFLLSLRAIQAAEVDAYNRYLIPRWVRTNWGGVPESEYPRVTAARLDNRDVAAWFAAVKGAVDSGVAFDPDTLRDTAYQVLGIEPPASEGTPGAAPAQDAGETGEVEPREDSAGAVGVQAHHLPGAHDQGTHAHGGGGAAGGGEGDSRENEEFRGKLASKIQEARRAGEAGDIEGEQRILDDIAQDMEGTGLNNFTKSGAINSGEMRVPQKRKAAEGVAEGVRRGLIETRHETDSGVIWGRALAGKSIPDKMRLTPEGMGLLLSMWPHMAVKEVHEAAAEVEEVDTQPPAVEGQARTTDGRLESEIKLEALGIAPRFDAMESALDAGRDRIVERVGKLQAKQAKRLAAIGMKLVKSGDAGLAARILAGEADVDKLADGNGNRLVPYDAEAAAFEEEMLALYEQGLDEFGRELAQQGVKPAAPDAEQRDKDRAYLFAFGLAGAALLADRMANAWAMEVMRQMRGVPDADAMLAAVAGASDKLLTDLAGQRANTAMATGRQAALSANGEVIGRVVLTAVMDRNTCPPCYQLDGTEYPADKAPTVPLYECEGRTRCRCQIIPIVES